MSIKQPKILLFLFEKKHILKLKSPLTMRDTYIKMMNELEERNIRRVAEHFDFSRDHLSEVYDSFLSYANVHLQKKAKDLSFPSTYIYIRKDDTINAYASSTDKYKILGFHHGAFKQMYEFFEAQVELLAEIDYQLIRMVLQETENPTFYAFFQYFMLFIYYHEYAHLVQGSRKENFYHMVEYSSSNFSEYTIDRHAREFDADHLACNALGILVLQHFLNEQEDFLGTNDELTSLVTVALTGIFCFFWIAPGGNSPLYFKEYDHPHPYVRISYIAVYICKIINEKLPEGIQLDSTKAVNDAVKLAELMISIKFPVAVRRFAEEFTIYTQQISDYVNEIIDCALGMPELCNNQPSDILS